MTRRQCPDCQGWGHPPGRDELCPRCVGTGIAMASGDRPHVLTPDCWCHPSTDQHGHYQHQAGT